MDKGREVERVAKAEGMADCGRELARLAVDLEGLVGIAEVP